MKKLLVVAAACLLALGAQAQWVAQGGANFSSLKFSDLQNPGTKIKTATGYSFGLTYDVKLPLGLGINTGLMFLQRNATSENGADESMNRYSSLELPVNLMYHLRLPLVSPFAIAGPYLDCGLWNKVDGRKAEYGDELKRFNCGITAGVGVDIVKLIRVMYQYDWGLTDLAGTEWDSYMKAKNRTHRVTVGVLF